ncbi:lanthionine synthetase C family protein [Streptomyces sp. RK23]|uniref:lanthionine synthetase C family protein n=1 Tax=unclassified Streptomyces TaxID=2593676 RepID=UPI001B3910FB|nr:MULTISPECIES: lanthionine synthetase C family protein [unclassified Streptomyces]MBQ0967510.1 lanthionine synthetase C family protein [Streptomyces sp. RK74B]MBQ1008044.1 lanthionine synthetase C family protein [Streptomyces sp. RK23]
MNHDDLGGGLTGNALYEMVIAREHGDWAAAHAAARAIGSRPVTAHPAHANLYRGAPAVAYVLHTAGHHAYARSLARLDAETVAIVADRLDAARRRMDSGRPPRLREYDLISGLTGLGAYLLHRGRDNVLEHVLRYLVRLITEPLTVDGLQVPGWWAATDPRDAVGTGQFAHGHANFGIAHGVTGPLALLALARRAGHTVDGQDDALAEGIAHLTAWAQPSDNGSIGWPELLPLDAYRKGPEPGAAPGRPSWCYGAPGIARALQLAALALRDDAARRLAERTALQAVTDSRQILQITDASVCHGWAGLLLATDRIAADSALPDLTGALPALHTHLASAMARAETPENAGLLTGNAGVRLTQHTLHTAHPLDLGWETCLLLN